MSEKEDNLRGKIQTLRKLMPLLRSRCVTPSETGLASAIDDIVYVLDKLLDEVEKRGYRGGLF